VRLLFFRVGGVTLEVAARLESGAEKTSGPSGEPADPDHDRLWGLSWLVHDADDARARLMETGFDVSEVREGRKPGTRVLTVRDGTCDVPTLLIEPREQSQEFDWRGRKRDVGPRAAR
jgi:hypothetical protein